jgi:hypothetical protein
MKNFIFVIIFISFAFIGCNSEKITQLEYNLTQLRQENLRLNNDNLELKNEIKILAEENQKLKETDQYYYQSGVDEYNMKHYLKTIEWMNNLKLKFPQSNLISSADRLIRDSNFQIQEIYQKEKQMLNQIISNARKAEIEDSIAMLNDYVSEDHPQDLIATATKSLNSYKTEYEKIREERELEQSLGVRLVEYATGWGFVDDLATQLFVPQLRLVFKNITDYPLRGVEIKTNFIKTSGNEIFGDSNDTLVYEYTGTALEPGYSKTIFATCNVGYRNEISFSSAPDLYANVYVNNRFYKRIAIAKKNRQ